ncbi:MAG: SulP family inorganic anion transporter [Planctomycetia bacterium]|nr:SulP family inorganic anion transporter [Planctomycetia bacterium]
MSSHKDHETTTATNGTPRGNMAGFFKYLQHDIISGFLVFLVALPLCLGISLACGYPAIAGVFTAIIGAILTSFMSNAELTIKGPAAGLIVIAIGAVTEFGFTGGQDPAADMQAYRMALAVGVAAGVIQIAFGLVRAGALGDFFPTAAVHGMLAAIGIIIVLKQLPVTFGETAKGEPFEIIRELPEKFAHANPEVAIIGGISLLILFGLPLIKHQWVKMVPAPLIVLLVAVPMGIYLDLSHEHTYTMFGHQYELGETFLVNVPNNMFQAITSPDFSALKTVAAWKWVIMFSLIGSLESLLSAKAIDMLDPWKRKTDLNRDLIAVGIANTVAASVGGLPMISEIVRSKANIDNGARTRFADMWHGVFLLGFVSLIPFLIHRIPLGALAAMLVYTGFRLGSPKEFLNVYKIGREQLVIFVVTVIAVLATDLLVGIAIGIGIKFMIHVFNGVPIRSLFKPYLDVETRGDNTVVIFARESAVFSNWLPFRRQIEQLGLVERNNVVLDLSGTKMVDHSVMEKLHEMEMDFEQAGLQLEIVGLESHRQVSDHPHAARKRGFVRLRRVTIVAQSELESQLVDRCIALGASGYTSIPCYGAGRRTAAEGRTARNSQVRIEIVVPPEIAEQILDFVRRNIAPEHAVTACVETVEVLQRDQF